MMARLLFAAAALLMTGCGSGINLLPEPFTRERADGKIPVKIDLIRAQVWAELTGTPEGEAEVRRWQQIETDYNDCRLLSGKAKTAKEQVFAKCMSDRDYVYMYPIDAEQLHNDIDFEITRERDRRIAAERKAEEERIAAARKAEEERIAAEEKRQAEEEYRLWQNKLNTALIAAVRNGDTAEEARLIEDGANPQVAEDEYNRIFAEREAEEKRIAAKKKRQKEQEHFHRQKELNDALLMAVQNRNNGGVAEIKRLIDDGANVNIKQKGGWTPLHFSAGEGHTEIALAFIKAGAYIDAKNMFGMTPLHYATGSDKTETALALIKSGADIDTKSKLGLTPLYVAANQGATETALALIKAGADIEASNNNSETPLYVAARNGQTKILNVLIKAGADIDEKTIGGFTPLHIAVLHGQAETAFVLIKAGVDIDATDNYGETPLHIAISHRKTEIALALINAGAYLKAKNYDGHTPLDVARRRKQWGIVKILQNPPPPKPSGDAAANVATAPAPEDSNVAERVFTNAWRSVVYIQANDSQGGGVIIKPNIVATNCHVVDSGNIIVYKSKNRRTDKSKQYRATIRHRDTKRDFCLLDVSGLLGFTAEVRRYDTLRIGESVYGIGAPQGLDLSLTSGLISQKRTEKGVRKIQTDTAISPGSSGGGLFDRKGNLIGIMTSKFVDEEVEGIGFAIPADLAL